MSRREEYNRFSGGKNLPEKDSMTPEEASKITAEQEAEKWVKTFIKEDKT